METRLWIEIFGVLTGIIYVILEVRQNRLLWPLGILTSSVYIYVFFHILNHFWNGYVSWVSIWR